MGRAELPLSRRSDGGVDAVVGNGALHVLSTGGGWGWREGIKMINF
jgi:hypothetical protein